MKHTLWIVLMTTILLVACGKSDEPKTNPQKGGTSISMNVTGEVDLKDLIASVNSRATVFDFTALQANPFKNRLDKSGEIEVTCILTNIDTNIAPIYFASKWEYKVSDHKLVMKTHDQVTLPAYSQNKWFLTAVINGTWDKNNHRISFDTAGKLYTFAAGEQVSLDIPFATTHTEIVHNESAQAMRANVIFKPRGILMYAKVQSLLKFPATVKGLHISSNAYSIKGYYDISPNHVKTYSNTTFPAWISTETPSSTATYLTASTPFTISQGTTWDKFFVWWMMPIQGITSPNTYFYLNATGLQTVGTNPVHLTNMPGIDNVNPYDRRPSIKKILSYHSKKLQSEGRAFPIGLVMERPELGIEYFADYNWKGETDPSQGRFAQNHSSTTENPLLPKEYGLYLRDHPKFGYTTPLPDEWNAIGVAHHKAQYAGNSDSGLVLERISIDKKDVRELYSHYRSIGSVGYALRFVSSTGVAEDITSAYKYEYVTQDGIQGLKVSVRFLGRKFQGNIDHVATPIFWAQADPDEISKFFPAHGHYNGSTTADAGVNGYYWTDYLVAGTSGTQQWGVDFTNTKVGQTGYLLENPNPIKMSLRLVVITPSWQ